MNPVFNHSHALNMTSAQCKENPVLWSSFGNGQPLFEPVGYNDCKIISINILSNGLTTTIKLPGGLSKEDNEHIGYVSFELGKEVKATGIFSSLNGDIYKDKFKLSELLADIAAQNNFIVLRNRNDGFNYRIR